MSDNLEQQVRQENQQNNEQVPVQEQQEQSYQPKDEWEERALKIGWNPNHQSDNFVDAREYVLRKPLFERIESQNKHISKQTQEINELKDAVRQSLDHVVSMRKEAYEATIKNIENAKLSAVEESNVSRYQELEKQAQEIKQYQQKDPIINQPKKPQFDPDVNEFAERNKEWYNSNSAENRKMVAAATAIDTFLFKQYQIDQGLNPDQMPVFDRNAHLREIEKRIKDIPEFQHRFKKEGNYMSSLGKSTVSSSQLGNSNSSALVSRLTEQQRKFGQTFERTSGGKYTLEMYAKDLEKQGKLNR